LTGLDLAVEGRDLFFFVVCHECSVYGLNSGFAPWKKRLSPAGQHAINNRELNQNQRNA